MTYRDAAKKLKTFGSQELPGRGGGSHQKRFNPSTQRATALPDWRGKDLKIDALLAAVRQLGIE